MLFTSHILKFFYMEYSFTNRHQDITLGNIILKVKYISTCTAQLPTRFLLNPKQACINQHRLQVPKHLSIIFAIVSPSLANKIKTPNMTTVHQFHILFRNYFERNQVLIYSILIVICQFRVFPFATKKIITSSDITFRDRKT